MARVESPEVDHEVVLIAKFRRYGIPDDERQMEAFIETARRSLELTFGDGLKLVTVSKEIDSITYCPVHDGIAIMDDVCSEKTVERGQSTECQLVAIFPEVVS